jgi:hypothetical protein
MRIYWPIRRPLVEGYFGAIDVASNTLSNAMIASYNYRCDSLSTKHAVYGVASLAMYKMTMCPH